MGNDCMSRDGDILHFPRVGGWHEQNRLELSLMKIARNVKTAFQLLASDNPKTRNVGAEAVGNMHFILNTPTVYSPDYLIHYG